MLNYFLQKIISVPWWWGWKLPTVPCDSDGWWDWWHEETEWHLPGYVSIIVKVDLSGDLINSNSISGQINVFQGTIMWCYFTLYIDSTWTFWQFDVRSKATVVPHIGHTLRELIWPTWYDYSLPLKQMLFVFVWVIILRKKLRSLSFVCFFSWWNVCCLKPMLWLILACSSGPSGSNHQEHMKPLAWHLCYLCTILVYDDGLNNAMIMEFLFGTTKHWYGGLIMSNMLYLYPRHW
jgi:hypothetical protein